MPIFEIETPEGSFEVEAPDEQTALRALGGSLPNQAPIPPQRDGTPQADKGWFRTVDDAVRGAADMMTFGFSDEISAGLGSLTGLGGNKGDYEGNVAAQRQRDAEGGGARFAGQVAGALAMPGSLTTSVPKAIGQGALVGGAYGFGSGEGSAIDRLPSAGLGAVMGGVAGGAVRGIANKLGTRAASKAIPSEEQLKKTAEAGFRKAEEAGVIIKPEGMRRLATEVVNDLAQFGYHPQLQPRIAAVLNEMERVAQGNTTYKGLDLLRRITANAASSNDASERAAATKIIQRIDDYMRNLPADDVLTGNAAQASAGIREGRDTWARFRRSEMVNTAAVKAERRAASTGSGGNLENALRQNVRSILDNPRRSRGMTAAEKEMAEKVVRGTPGQNALRLAGKLSPTTGGLQAALNVGATAFNPMMAIPGAIGFGAKAAAERMTTKNVQRLSEMIRSGGQTGQALARLARNGQLNIPEVKRVEYVAKMLGISMPELAAAIADRVTAK